MNRVLAYLETVTRSIAHHTTHLGQSVYLDTSVLDRSDAIALTAPGLVSANRSARMIRTKDGWIAANLPRDDDLLSVPALLRMDSDGDPWAMLDSHASNWTSSDLIEQAEMLGLALARISETPVPRQPCDMKITGASAQRKRVRVIDFSSLWAGPLCGSVFAAMGAEVVKIESAERPDPTANSAPALDQRLNGAKSKKRVALSTLEGAANLRDYIAQTDVLITSARARALNALGLTHESMRKLNPTLVWIAITGHGWHSTRIAFGDDAAAAGGLVAYQDDAPHFLGDAVADPITGLAAADAALSALQQGRPAFVDAALAKTAAYVAALRP